MANIPKIQQCALYQIEILHFTFAPFSSAEVIMITKCLVAGIWPVIRHPKRPKKEKSFPLPQSSACAQSDALRNKHRTSAEFALLLTIREPFNFSDQSDLSQ